MKITYRREMKHNYLIIDPETLTWKNYECSMLAENVIEGVLHFQLRQTDDEIRFYYEITSKQPLKRMLEGRAIQKEEIRRLVLGISAVLDRMEQYLLREGCILMDPDYIYVDPETFRIWLCLVPGLERDFPEDYGKFLEYLLGRVDHQDKESVVLAYSLYQETRKENYGMEDILRLLWPERKKPAAADGNPMTRDMIRENASDRRQSDQDTDRDRVDRNASDRNTGIKEERKEKKNKKKKSGKEKGKSLWQRFREWLHHGDRETPEKGEETYGQVPFELLFREDEPTDFREHAVSGEFREPVGSRESAGAREPVGSRESAGAREPKTLFQPYEKEAQAGNERDTVLLADLSQNTERGTGSGYGTGLRILKAMDPEMENIQIGYFPFIIGKQENLVDAVLMRDTVSRLHLRIDQGETGWMIQDLNSTNGTMVAGKLLENNESVELHIGDEVKIAEYRFRFE